MLYKIDHIGAGQLIPPDLRRVVNNGVQKRAMDLDLAVSPVRPTRWLAHDGAMHLHAALASNGTSS